MGFAPVKLLWIELHCSKRVNCNKNLSYLATAPATTRTAAQRAEQIAMAAMCAPFSMSSEPPAMKHTSAAQPEQNLNYNYRRLRRARRYNK